MIEFSQVALAFSEGLALAISPCILPILPFLLAASLDRDRWRPFQIVVGFITTFVIFTLVSRKIVLWTGIQQDQIQYGALILFLIMGLIMVIPWFEDLFSRLTGGVANKASEVSSGQITRNPLGGFVIGGLIGLVWTPCAGPILAVALIQVIQAQTDLHAVIILLAFSFGAGVPMLAIGYFGHYLSSVLGHIKKHAVMIRRIFGILIIGVAGLGLMGINLAQLAVTPSVAAESSMSEGLANGLAKPYDAPKLDGGIQWFNSKPLTLQELKGKVVLVDFWTYSCINCIRTLPHIKSWYAKYKDKGLVVIGVHTPEFAFEGQPKNVQAALGKFGITYPVVMDNNFKIWNSFSNKYWPAHYLINRDGKVVYTHFGEGQYDVTEQNIRHLLGVTGEEDSMSDKVIVSSDQTPETYLGTERAEAEYNGMGDIPMNQWQLKGKWMRTGQYIESGSAATLKLHYKARKVFLVMASANHTPIDVTIKSDLGVKTLTVDQSQLYDIVIDSQSRDSTVELTTKQSGLRLYAFTFES